MRKIQEQNESQQEQRVKEFGGFVQYFSSRLKSNRAKFNTGKKLKDYYYSHPQFLAYLDTIKDVEHDPKKYQSLTKEILLFLESGHNICLYGKGSKYDYLESISGMVDRTYICKIKGFSSALNQKIIINKIGDLLYSYGLLKIKQKVQPLKLIQKYREALEVMDPEIKILIVIHNLDGQNIFEADAQHLLSYLGTLPNVNLLCSIDSIKTPLHWAPETLSNFGFIFHHVSTQRPYKRQFSCLLRANQRKQRLQQSLKLIIKGLNQMQKQIIKIIARKALKNLNEGTNDVYSYSELLQECIQEAVLGTDYQLRENLIELTDHKVLEMIAHENKKKGYVLSHAEKRFLEFILEEEVVQPPV